MPTPITDTASSETDRARHLWRSCLASAFRTALACAIVGCATLYAPSPLRRTLAFPAFSYVTVILLVTTNAALGDALRGCWHAFYATVQGAGLAALSLWVIGPTRLSNGTVALAAAVSAFAVALPEWNHLVSKRIALGQIVIVYVVAFIDGGESTEGVLHSVHVAASTAVGVAACVLALLFPYPRLACYEVKEICKQFAGNASERLKLFVKAFCAKNHAAALESLSHAKSLAVIGSKLLQRIKLKQEGMQWERVPFKISRPHCRDPGDRLEEEVEMLLRGMEIALTSSSFPVELKNQDLKNALLELENDLHDLTLKQVKSYILPNSQTPTVPEFSYAQNVTQFLQSLQTFSPTPKDLPSLFFLFCFKLLHCRSKAAAQDDNSLQKIEASTGSSHKHDHQEHSFKWDWSICNMEGRRKRLMPAFKCSLSLGLAVLLGLMYSKENGYWSGLPLAIGLTSAREATFKIANVKAQGTVIGTVYGELGCFLFGKFSQLRFLSLLPWFIFTSFLQRSRMYGQAGGFSAVIGAVQILGRKNFGGPSEFAIARITETFIGLSCSIIVEVLLQPTRASTLSKIQLSASLGALHECVRSISLSTRKSSLGENQKKLRMQVNELKQLIGEAQEEPNFWFLPFHGACYGKLLRSLSKMADLLHFGDNAIGFLEKGSDIFQVAWEEVGSKLDGDLELFKEMVCSSMKCFEEVTLVKSLKVLEKELERQSIDSDIEFGKSSNTCRVSGLDEDHEMEKIITSYLHHSKELVDKKDAVVESDDHDEEQKSQVVLSLGALGFCLWSSMKECREIEKGIKELVEWENPSVHNINLYEISCKLRASQS
ncbi:uncharacterized protein LOC131148061 [Malania oleifera]|uniref:uncharacterized protein LOC131148061 n=1 Tax=Malania oleifera TaxID=397392 RepID=UPI0025AE0139|nr:uncharacterized protein LOC131148061 [Malania oleifera]